MAETTEIEKRGRAFHGTLAPLSIPDFRRLLVGNTLWWQAMFMEMIVTGWLVLELTDSAWQVALIGFYRSAPVVLVGFFSGPAANRFGRIRVILLSQAATVVILAVITLLLWADSLAFWHLSVCAILLGILWTLSWTARRSLMPDLVGKAGTVDAMLLENFMQSTSRVLGPFAGGAVIAALGALGGYAAVTGISALSLIAVVGISPHPRPARPKASPWTLMVEGLRYVRRNPPILGDVLITVAMNFLAFPYMTLLPVFARDILNQGPVGLGLLGAGSGVGSFLGLFAVNRARRVFSNGWIFSVGSFIQAAALIGFAASGDFYLSLGMLILSGMGQACFSVMQSAIVLITASDDMRDRAMGAIAIGIGTGPPGRLQVGALAEAFGAPFAVGITAIAASLSVVIITAALPGFRKKADEEPSPPKQ